MSQLPLTYDHFDVVLHPDGSPWILGKGSMGVTFKAFDKRLQCHVALKVIQSALFADQVARERFLREARTAASINHPNVASVFYLGQNSDEIFYAMELVEGVSLEEDLRKNGPIDPALAIRYTIEICRALQALFRAGLVHRDIKPSNIMLLNNGDGTFTPKLVDFGLAKSVIGAANGATLSMAPGFLGTPYYASPEQLNEEAVDPRSDIYSLGATLFALLSGHPPFQGTLASILDQSLSAPPPLEQLPEFLRPTLGKMLAKKPEERYQSPQELRSALEVALSQMPNSSAESGSSRPPHTVEPPPLTYGVQGAPQPAESLVPTPPLPPLPLEQNQIPQTRFSLLEVLKKRRSLPGSEVVAVLEAMSRKMGTSASPSSRNLVNIFLRGTELSISHIAECRDLEASFVTESIVDPEVTSQTASSLSDPLAPTQVLAHVAYELLGGYHQVKDRWSPVPSLSAEGNAILRQGIEKPSAFASTKDFVAALFPKPAGASRTLRRSPVPTSLPHSPPPLPRARSSRLWIWIAGAGVAMTFAAAASLFLVRPLFQRTQTPTSPKEVGSNTIVPSAQVEASQPLPTPGPTVTTSEPKPPEDPATPYLKAAEEAQKNDDNAGILNNYLLALEASPQLEEPLRQLEMISAKLRSNAVKLNRQKFDLLRSSLEKAASRNVVSAQVLLAEKLRKTEPSEALKWFTAAAKNGQTEAMTQAGLMLANGNGRNGPDFAAAVGWFQMGASAGDSDSMVSLADCYLNGKGVARNPARAIEILQTAAALNQPFALSFLGDIYRKGVPGILSPDYVRALSCYESARKFGLWDAQASLGVMFLNGQGIPNKDPQKAVALWKDGAEIHENPACMFLYARSLEDGLVGERNPAMAREWFLKAARANHPGALDWCKKNNLPVSE